MSAPGMTPAQVAARVAGIIRSRPELYSQRNWWNHEDREDWVDDDIPVADILAVLDGAAEPCGTTCCVAGWAAALTAPAGAVFDGRIVKAPGDDDYWLPIDHAAARALGIPWPEHLRYADTLWLFEQDRTREEVLAELDRIAGATS